MGLAENKKHASNPFESSHGDQVKSGRGVNRKPIRMNLFLRQYNLN